MLQLFRKLWDRKPQRDTSAVSASVRGMMESGDFRIDLKQRTVTLHGEGLHLTADEFDVLVFMAGHPQRLVTPRSSNPERLPQTRFLKSLISLRKKLEAAEPGKHYLSIEPWFLYRFEPGSSSTA